MSFETSLRYRIQHFHPQRYWKYRERVIDPNKRYPKWLKLLWLYKVKRSDAFNNASLGTHLGYGASFASMPSFPHGLYGIIVSHNAVIGRDCTIFHQVTIGEGNGGAPQIGDGCYIGAGAKILGGIRIGNNVRIGANCIVVDDVPDNCTVVMNKPRLLIRES